LYYSYETIHAKYRTEVIKVSANVMELLMIVFNDKDSAKEALKELKGAQKEGLIEIVNAAVLDSNEKGKIHYKELADLKHRKKGRLLGGGAGVLLTVLGGPAGLLVSTAAGVVVGGGLSRLKDKGVPNDKLKDMASKLEPDSSALIALVEHVWVDKVIEEVAEYTKEVVKAELEQEVVDTLLEEGN